MNTTIFISEFIGTFIFILVILITKNPIFISATFLISIIISKTSGSHLNPLVTLMSWLNKNITSSQIIIYLGAQVLASIVAYILYNLYLNLY